MTILENPDANVESVYSLHPTTLFHFTKNEDAFYSILAEKYFKPFLAREEIRGVGDAGGLQYQWYRFVT